MVAIPEGVTVEVANNEVTAKGPKGEVKKKFSKIITVEKKDNEVLVTGSEKEKAYIGTVNSIVNSMFHGVKEGFMTTMKVLHAHFPATLEVQGDKVVIKNFIGEKHPRKSRVMENAKVEVKGANVTVSGPDKEAVGQTIANLKAAMKIKEKDCRIFQDGIYETG